MSEQVDEPDRGPVGPLPIIFPFDLEELICKYIAFVL
ncbi:MAG: hypothetical protein A4E62_02777 [Syntrophorhabdus sp. PtaU1.Bin002]|nr:MAG: hypothetical protein A4E62_02777 [Syntrophorhabdus sp. PtaU1.Bin002]